MRARFSGLSLAAWPRISSGTRTLPMPYHRACVARLADVGDRHGGRTSRSVIGLSIRFEPGRPNAAKRCDRRTNPVTRSASQANGQQGWK